MKSLSTYIFSFLFLLAMSCNSNTQSSPMSNKKHIGKINKVDFSEKLKAVANPQLIDVRTPKEFNAGHLENAVNINYRAQDFNQQIAKLDKKRPVFVYCKSGGRSGKSTTAMEKIGFEEVYDLEGGYDGWSK